MASTRQLVDDALGILRNKQISIAEKRRELKSAVEPRFDFADMAHSSLSTKWDSLSPEQHQSFVALFTAFIEDAYLNKIQDYSGQQVQFLGESQPDPGYAQVRSQILQPGGKQPVAVNYVLRQENGRWLIYDVTVENISIIANYRNQFNRVINRSGFDTLMADLKNKQEQLASQLGTRHSSD